MATCSNCDDESAESDLREGTTRYCTCDAYLCVRCAIENTDMYGMGKDRDGYNGRAAACKVCVPRSRKDALLAHALKMLGIDEAELEKLSGWQPPKNDGTFQRKHALIDPTVKEVSTDNLSILCLGTFMDLEDQLGLPDVEIWNEAPSWEEVLKECGVPESVDVHEMLNVASQWCNDKDLWNRYGIAKYRKECREKAAVRLAEYAKVLRKRFADVYGEEDGEGHEEDE